MKTNLFLLLMSVSCLAVCQELHVSSETGLITYEKIIDAPGKSADELFGIAKTWMVSNFTNAKDIAESKPNAMSMTFITDIGGWGLGKQSPFRLALVIKVKEGAIKLIIDNMVNIDTQTVGGPYSAESYWKKKDGTIRDGGMQQKPLKELTENCNSLGKSLEAKILKGDKW